MEVAADEDDGGGDVGEGLVEVGAAFVAGEDAAPGEEPGVGPFDRPAFAGFGVGVLGRWWWWWWCGRSFSGVVAAAADVRGEAAAAGVGATCFGVVAAVGVELGRWLAVFEGVGDAGWEEVEEGL